MTDFYAEDVLERIRLQMQELNMVQRHPSGNEYAVAGTNDTVEIGYMAGEARMDLLHEGSRTPEWTFRITNEEQADEAVVRLVSWHDERKRYNA